MQLGTGAFVTLFATAWISLLTSAGGNLLDLDFRRADATCDSAETCGTVNATCMTGEGSTCCGSAYYDGFSCPAGHHCEYSEKEAYGNTSKYLIPQCCQDGYFPCSIKWWRPHWRSEWEMPNITTPCCPTGQFCVFEVNDRAPGTTWEPVCQSYDQFMGLRVWNVSECDYDRWTCDVDTFAITNSTAAMNFHAPAQRSVLITTYLYLGIAVCSAFGALLMRRFVSRRQARLAGPRTNIILNQPQQDLYKPVPTSSNPEKDGFELSNAAHAQQPPESEALQYRKTLWVLGCVVLLTGFYCLVLGIVVLLATRRYSKVDETGSQDSMPLYMGQCESSSVKTYNLIAHLIVNIIGTVILASSAFIQRLSTTPSEEDVISRVRGGKDIRIGSNVPQRFLKHNSWLWLFMLATSLPVHLLLNSATGIAIRPIEKVGVWAIRQQDLRTFDTIRMKLSNGIHFAPISIPWEHIEGWKSASSEECVDLIEEQDLFVLRYRNIAVVLEEDSPLNDPTAGWELYGDPHLAPYISTNVSYANMTDARSTTIDASHISHCYVDEYPSSCQVSIRWLPLLVTGVLVILKGIFILSALRYGRHFRQRLISCLGDLIALAEENPGLFPLRSDTLVKLKFKASKNKLSTFSHLDIIWITVSCLIAVILIAVGAGQSQGMKLSGGRDEAYSISLGSMNKDTLMKSPPSSFMAAAILTNLPQLFLSVWYLIWNNIISRSWAEREWRSFYLQNHKIRVSNSSARPGRRPSPWLQFPYWLTALLMLVSVFGHWICSQMLTIIEILQSIELERKMFINYSSIALLCVGALVLAMTLGLSVYALLRRKVLMPLMEGSSWTVLYCCNDMPRPLPEEGLAWGDISDASGRKAGFGVRVNAIQEGAVYPLSSS